MSCRLNLDIYYNEIVHCLMVASHAHIPRIPCSALKHYWSSALDDLKQDCIQAHNVWDSAGRPRSGSIFELKQNAKYRYKLAIKDAANQFESRFDDELAESYLSKDFNTFWRLWKNKVHAKKPHISHVAGHSDDIGIANAFAAHFSDSVTHKASVSLSDAFSSANSQSSVIHEWLFNIEEVEQALLSLKLGKAVGIDGISSEHLRYAHPSIVTHLKMLFNLMLLHGYVPDKFGCGIIVPLLKDRLGDVSSLDNYRAITISSIISKVFEITVRNKFSDFFASHELQFGFKKNLGCQNAVFTVQQVANYFNQRGSTVFMAALDATKAFDRICHLKLFNKLVERNVPSCLIVVLCDWYKW